jgi:hypothetical protein
MTNPDALTALWVALDPEHITGCDPERDCDRCRRLGAQAIETLRGLAAEGWALTHTPGPDTHPAVDPDAHTSPTRLGAGLYLTTPPGHALLSDGRRCLVVENAGGVIDVAGLAIRDPDVLDRLGEHLRMLADRLRRKLGDSYHPVVPSRELPPWKDEADWSGRQTVVVRLAQLVEAPSTVDGQSPKLSPVPAGQVALFAEPDEWDHAGRPVRQTIDVHLPETGD